MTGPLRVLLVEDSSTDAKLVVNDLARLGLPVEHYRVEDAPSMRAALAERTWDLVLSDWSMPHFSALGALEVLKQSGVDLPFIIISGVVGEECAADAMRAGAHDFVLKDKLARLAPAVERELRESRGRAERQRAETMLTIQAARFQALIEKSEEAITLTRPDGTTAYMSPSVRRILGMAPEEMVGRSAFERLHPEDRERVVGTLARLIDDPLTSITVDFRFLHPDGSCRWIEATGTNLMSDPAVGGIVGNLRDVTDRKRATDELRASEERYRRIIEATNQGVWAMDAESKTTFMNARMADMLGYGVSEVLGMSKFEFVADAARRGLARAMEDHRAGIATQVERELKRKDGTSRWVLLEWNPMLDESGRYLGATAMATDLTERKGAEAALHQSAEQLRQLQKMEAVGSLAGGVAHDFNNVLSVILGYADMMLEDLKKGDPMRDDLEEIRKAGERAGSLTRQLLLFSRQEVQEVKVINLNETLASMDRMLRRIVGEDVEVVSVPAPSLGRVLADPTHVEQVIMNLVVNARDAMRTGGKLTMETQNVVLDEAYARGHLGVKPGPHVMLAVTDTGIGMDAETQARIFEPFYTTKEKGRGTGLGLSTVFGIVKQSEGSIWVYSEPGRGSTFKVYLPRTDLTPGAARSIAPSSTRGGSETVLLVEDEDQVRAVAHGILKRGGYRVIEARNAGEALLLCEQPTPQIDLLLTDVVMPQMSGPVLATRIALLRPDMKVLCMSGYTDDTVVRHGMLQAEIPFLQKPFTAESMLRKVREVLDTPCSKGTPVG